MQQPQPICEKCGQEHTAPYKSTRGASDHNRTNPQDIDMTKKFIMIMIRKLAGLCTINSWCIDKASLFKKDVELLSNFAHCQGLHELFPAKDDKVGNINELIARLGEACEKLIDGEEKSVQDILQRQICALKVIECKVYSVADGTVDGTTESEDAIEQEDQAEDHEDDGHRGILTGKKTEYTRTESTPVNLQIKVEENSAMEIGDYQPDDHGNATTTTVPDHGMGTDSKDFTKSPSFDVRYHYRRANKCARCASSNKSRGGKDCFFPLVLIRKALDKCTNCRHSGYKCEFPTLDYGGTDRLVSAEQSPKLQYPDHRQLPTPTVVLTVPTTPPTTPPAPADVLLASALPNQAVVCLPSTALTPAAVASFVPTQVISAAVPVIASVDTAIIGNGKRKAASESRGSSSSPIKHRRIHDAAHQPMAEFFMSDALLVDKATMLRQVTRLNISFESFTDMSFRQAESHRKHCEQEAAFEKHKQAYEESKRVFEERKRAYEESMQILEEKKQVFEDSERLCGENKPIYTARQECFATRAESAGENIIEEASNLLSSIEQRPTPKDIEPALQRLHTVFGDFIRVQGELFEEHKFKGDRAQLLHILMERIQKVVDIEVLVEGTGSET